jgi:hypothetical protein
MGRFSAAFPAKCRGGSVKIGAMRRVGLAALALTACACMLAIIAVASQHGAPAALMSATRQSFLDKLNAILLKKTNKKMLGSEDNVLKAQESVARARRGRRNRNAFSKAQLEANACADGEPCSAGVGVANLGPKPKMVYQPSTGNWDVVDAGNPDWVWQHLMQRAKQRDQAGLGAKPPAHAAHIRKQQPQPFVQNKARAQSLLQLGSMVTPGSAAEVNKQTLLLKLKSILREKMAAGEPVQPKPSESIMAVAAAQDFSQPGVASKVTKLKDDIKRGAYLGRVGDLSDMPEMKELDARLVSTRDLGEICRRRHLAQDGLGVLKDSSLAGCEREIRAHMDEARVSLKGGLARLRAKKARLEFPKQGSLPQLQQKKRKLAAELSSMEKQHDQLRAELSQQKERITQLTQRHRYAQPSAATSTAVEAARSLLGFSSSAASGTPLADALEGKSTRAVRSSAHRGRAQRRHMPKSRAWSPPVPAGLPPGYEGSLRAQGATDVPEVPPPGTAV